MLNKIKAVWVCVACGKEAETFYLLNGAYLENYLIDHLNHGLFGGWIRDEYGGDYCEECHTKKPFKEVPYKKGI